MNWLLLILALLAVVAMLAPFEALGWWAGWTRRDLEPAEEPPRGPAPPKGLFVIYLTGIAGFSGEFLARRETGFLKRLGRLLPEAAIVADVFPFSVNNNPLNGERLLRGLWQWLHERRTRAPHVLYDVLIVLRNLFQVAVSADPRYGPIYNVGVARELVRSLRRHGYPAAGGVPVALVAYSGGAQIAIGAARFLQRALNAPIRVVGLGGVLSDDPGLAAVARLDQVQSRSDWLPPLISLLFPGRWPLLPWSEWNRARREGRVFFHDPGPIQHVGRRDYFSLKARLPDGRQHGVATAEVVARLLHP